MKKKIDPAFVAKALGAVEPISMGAVGFTEKPKPKQPSPPKDYTLEELVDDVVGDSKVFYDPHPGFAGAVEPLPEPVRLIAELLDGQILALEKAALMIKSAAPKVSYVSVRHNHVYNKETHLYETDKNNGIISLSVDVGDLSHSWRVIRWRS